MRAIGPFEHIARYRVELTDAVRKSATLAAAQREVERILEGAYTGDRSLDDPVRDVARAELRAFEARQRLAGKN